MQVSRGKKDQIRTVERFLQDQHATFRNNLNRFGEPLPQQIAVFLRDLQDGLLAKLQLGLFKTTLIYARILTDFPVAKGKSGGICYFIIISCIRCALSYLVILRKKLISPNNHSMKLPPTRASLCSCVFMELIRTKIQIFSFMSNLVQ